ncbi:HAMP domain-containing histidine kinase [Sandaracinobacter neustonicus]|uniref:histidine kinase n=1 Tax=Sandaracinobacter neustonicus TaxID=1715348 RepID=A0A501XV27_9SPHN|nr:HAMP domain-containing sensor histidine kinase [Sandaracinobacter neustonicus]TPE63957.1 HAMP domain-containing histidine kinase [Sandaracinobacter neustonicus]
MASAAPDSPASLLRRSPGSISRRLLVAATIWIAALIALGGLALDRIVTGTIVRNFDAQLSVALPAMIAAAELDPFGDVRFNRQPVDPRFNEPYSGLYWQVAAEGHLPFRSRSLWDRELPADFTVSCVEPCVSRSGNFRNEPLRIVERDGIIPGSPVVWRFQVSQSTEQLDAQVRDVRRTLWLSLGVLGAGMLALAVLQATYGLMPLRRVSAAMAAIRAGRMSRAPTDDVPPEISPLVHELNALLDHNEKAAEDARMHAGNLAHALKTPMSVLTNEAAANSPDLAQAVVRELSTMRRHIDHHLARARAMGRRTASTARAEVWPSLQRLVNAIERIYAEKGVVIDIAGDRQACFRGERQDLEELAGNLIDNAAKYGGGRVFVTVSQDEGNPGFVSIVVEDDGQGIPVKLRESMFERGARLDTGKPGTGLGLAIVRDVADIYGGSIRLSESEDLGGLMAILRLPACPSSDKAG